MTTKQYLKTLRIDTKKLARTIREDLNTQPSTPELEGVEYNIDILEGRTLQLLSILEMHLTKDCTL